MTLFEKAGAEHTESVLKLAQERGESLGISTCVVATTRGRTALKACNILSGFKIVAVTHCTGFAEPNFQELPEDERERLEAAGVSILTATHAFGALGRAVRKKFGTYELEEIMANTLRIFGQGTKVAVEIALMAADAGLVQTGAPVLSVAGSGEGADTALVLMPANTHKFFETKVIEFICKPASW